MDFGKLKDLIGKCKTANYQAGRDEGRAEVSKEVCKSFDAELDWYLQECEAESKKNIVFQDEPLPPPPPTERRCRNCEWFIPQSPGGRETATAGHCYTRDAPAMEDLDHIWCGKWHPIEKLKAPPAKEEQPEKPAEALSGEEEDKEDDGDACCRDCWHFNDSRDWCCGHEMPTTAENGYTCPDFRPRPRFSPNPKKQEEQ